ncbi:hypothetical protein NECAME_11333 [Necator americanus]|uniref:Uncharacterized protein n=1 Tax=Necator americanus TaxID=51031 RepID=W2T5Z9_NECAM|nr:hypothetical protein NECAME_11333 [Necator americanus]ETN77049.1 hypothetical protein NECAME_11333 [Necator americanus]
MCNVYLILWIPATEDFKLLKKLQLGSQDVSNTLEYVPQFLQSPPNILPSASLSMGCPPSTPSRPWWLDSPLTAAAQSPLAAVASTLSGGSVTPLGPPTPLGVGAGVHFGCNTFGYRGGAIL